MQPLDDIAALAKSAQTPLGVLGQNPARWAGWLGEAQPLERPYPTNPDLQLSSKLPDKFTGKERDAESGLDYFEARYMSAAQGRFMSPDPENAGAFAGNPQSWNAYSYVVNNPLK